MEDIKAAHKKYLNYVLKMQKLTYKQYNKLWELLTGGTDLLSLI